MTYFQIRRSEILGPRKRRHKTGSRAAQEVFQHALRSRLLSERMATAFRRLDGVL